MATKKETELTEKPIEEMTDAELWAKKMTIYLPLDEQHQKPLYVCVNGHNMTIPRGEEHEVPYPIYVDIMESEEGDRLALQKRMNLVKSSML